MLGHNALSQEPISSIPAFTAGGAAAQPQRVHYWRPVSLIALGFFAAEEAPTAPKPSLHAYRSPAAAQGGMSPAAYTQLVLIEGEQDARRTDHNRVLIGRTAPTAATAGAPWYLWAQPAKRLEPEDDARRSSHNLLHQYRVGYQTVGQSYRQWPRSTPRLESEEYALPKPVDLTPFRNSQPPVATVGAPWYLWTKPQARIEAEEYTVTPSRYQYRQIVLQVQPGQPWWMWPKAVADQTIEPDPVVTDHAAALYPFRPHDAVVPPVVPDATQVPAGRKTRDRYIARFKGEDYVFATHEGLEEFVAWAIEAEKPKQKKYRKPVRIRLSPAFKEEISHFFDIPATIHQLPASKALIQVRQIELKLADEEDDAEWLILIA